MEKKELKEEIKNCECEKEDCDCDEVAEAENELGWKKLDEKERYRLKKLWVEKKKMDKELEALNQKNKKWDHSVRNLLGITGNEPINYQDLFIALL